MKRIFNTRFLLFHFGLGRSADMNDGHATGEFRQTLLQFLFVVIRRGVVDLTLDLLDASLDIGRLAGAFDDGRVFFVDDDLLGGAKIGQNGVLQLESKFFGDDLAVGQHGDIFQHGFAAITESGRLHRADFQRAAQFVDDQSRQRFGFDILGDDQQRSAGLSRLLQNRQQVFHRGDLLVVNQDVGIFHLGFHRFRIGDEVRRQIAAIELHTFDDFERGVGGLGFFNRDHAVFADFFHRIGDQLTNDLVVVGGNRADLGDLGLVADRLRLLLEFVRLRPRRPSRYRA